MGLSGFMGYRGMSAGKKKKKKKKRKACWFFFVLGKWKYVYFFSIWLILCAVRKLRRSSVAIILLLLLLLLLLFLHLHCPVAVGVWSLQILTVQEEARGRRKLSGNGDSHIMKWKKKSSFIPRQVAQERIYNSRPPLHSGYSRRLCYIVSTDCKF